MQTFKIVINGDSGVGKSSLILRYIDDTFSEDAVCTVSDDFRETVVTVDGQSVKLQLWDTAGQERYRIITSSFYHNADGTIIVYDLSSKDSFDNVARWSQEVDRYIELSIKVVVGNKLDLEGRSVTQDTADEVCDNLGAPHMLTSAMTGEGVTELFESAVRQLLAQAKLTEASQPDAGAAGVTAVAPQVRTGCCTLL